MKQPNTELSRRSRRVFASLAIASCALATSGLLNSCAYTETMNEREAEGQGLQRELGYEIERGRKLSR